MPYIWQSLGRVKGGLSAGADIRTIGETSQLLKKADFGTSTGADDDSAPLERILAHHLFANNQGLFFILFM